MTFTIGTHIYGNDESSFRCNTAQHLCEDICFNQFMPINYTRYWQWQTISLGLVAMFLVWLIDAEKQEMELLDKLQAEQNDAKSSYEEYKNLHRIKLEKRVGGRRRFKKFIDGKETEMSERTKAYIIGCLICLFAIDFSFLIGLINLLKHQHDYRAPLSDLIISGDILFTPPTYVCYLKKPAAMLKEKYETDHDNNIEHYTFKDTLNGLTVKALESCSQSDPLCTVVRYTEKTFILMFMLGANVIGVFILVIEIIRAATKVVFIRRRQQSRTLSLSSKRSNGQSNPAFIPTVLSTPRLSKHDEKTIKSRASPI